MLKKSSLPIALLLTALLVQPSLAQLKIGSFVRVKGQESNRLHGMGIVVGLKNGNGDPDADPTIRQLYQVLKTHTNSVGDPKAMQKELKGYKNIALVVVTATVPKGGARIGDRLDCEVQALGAKSLEGGRLFLAHLISDDPQDPTVYAYAEGNLTVDPASPTTGRVMRGTQINRNFTSKFVENGYINLVIKESHAGFAMAHEIATVINDSRDFQTVKDSTNQQLAHAKDTRNISVKIPKTYKDSPVEFVSYVLGTNFIHPPKAARVLIRRKSGTVIIDPTVEIRPVAVTHKRLVIAPDGGTPVGQFVQLDTQVQPHTTTRLQALVDALKALKVPTDDIIEIIINVHRSGAMYGELIIEP